MKDPSSEERLKRFAIASTNVAVLLLAALAVSVALWIYLTPTQEFRFTAGLHKGGRFSPLPAPPDDRPAKTLFIVIDPDSYDSTESLHFYRELTDACNEGKGTRVRAIFREDEGAVRAYMERNRLVMEASPSINFGTNNIDGAPTLILVEADGTILDFWIGRLTKDGERQVIEAASDSGKKRPL